LQYDGGFDGTQIVTQAASQTISDLASDANNTSAGDNQAGCGLLLVFSLGDSTGHLVEGVAHLQDWRSLSD
jgi:hypothetical protein